MLEAELLLRVPRMWLTEIPKRHEVSIRIVDRRPSGKYGVRDLVEVTGPRQDLEAILEELRSEPWVKSFDLDFVDSDKLVGEVSTYRCLACASLVRSNCYLVSAYAQRDGAIKWRVMTSSRDELKKLVAKLEKSDCEVTLQKLTSVDDREVLTDRQKEITLMAFEKGYFETPRRVKLKDLSRVTGVSQATLSEILRKGQKRIFVEYLRSSGKSL